MSSAAIVAYRDFYDRPRAFVLNIPTGGLLFFDCRFDESLDDYPSSYRVFALKGPLAELPVDWRHINFCEQLFVAEMPCAEIRFDISRRHEATIANLDALTAKAEYILAKTP